ncbi:MAG: NAD-dependent epimerase/dehydratase family protein [bacterium]|nr:NAD-dependent epimerase/dehydratase family protein [bacterium]
MKYLVFGGSQFVSWYIVKRLVETGNEVITITRGNKKNIHNDKVTEIYADRRDSVQLKSALKNIDIDYVIDVSGYNKQDISFSIEALKGKNINAYVFISSGAIYKENNKLPFTEISATGKNSFWGCYGTDKLEAENYLMDIYKQNSFPVVILRPPYIYGEGNNVYREAFIFDRLKDNKVILLPNKGETIIHFIHIEDLFKTIEKIIDTKIAGCIYNVGNENGITFKEWVKICMSVYGKNVDLIEFEYKKHMYEPRDFFPFHDYDFYLDVSKVSRIYKPEITLEKGLDLSLKWYSDNGEKVSKRDRYSKNIEHIVKSNKKRFF